ncbi:MAG: hypothetical protein LBU76_05880 [Azoarcus sp.]|jgi:hypothetical protein|nr:hypothetical protein [Azoarcus sp.]
MDTCEYIHYLFNRTQRYRFPFSENEIPKNGIYIMFEKGETAHSGDRIVSIGTHTGQDNLPSRLKEHFLRENKDRSIFRKNIGRALLTRNKDSYLEIWNKDLTSAEARKKYSGMIDRDKQREIEKEVTAHIQNNCTFIVFEVVDKNIRLELESKIISTVNLCKICAPSKNWLGNYSPKEKIRASGLWLVNKLNGKPLDSDDIKLIEENIK